MEKPPDVVNGDGDDDSDSEEDIDYAPSKRELAEAESEERLLKKQKLGPENGLFQQMKTSAKVASLWNKLKDAGPGKGSGSTFSYGTISSVNRTPTSTTVPASEREWMRQYGITTVVPQRKTWMPSLNSKLDVQGSTALSDKQDAASSMRPPDALPSKNVLADRALDVGLAAQALAMAKGGSSSTASQHHDKIAVTEVRRFAGKDVLVSKMASKEEADKLRKKEIERQSGLDSVLASLQNTKKVTLMDKSRDDWGHLKKSDAQLDEELEAYKKSGDKYLDKVDFLKRSELREYEAERDQRLQNDMRTRART